ncbi:MAG: hypothetical protein RIC52_00905, partial [Amphiplicatus sp.]
MTKAVEHAFKIEDDEEGAATKAASLGPDGGPLVVKPRYAEALDEIEEFGEDSSWLDEELSDEELAALGEEDFDEDALLEEEIDLLGEDDLDGADDFSLGDDFAAGSAAEKPALAATSILSETPSAASAVVKAGARLPDGRETEDTSVEPFLGEEEDDLDIRPVPRISIHAFCETPATSELLEQAAIDRRL